MRMHARVYASNSLPPYMWPVLLCSVRLSSLDEVGQISDRIKLLFTERLDHHRHNFPTHDQLLQLLHRGAYVGQIKMAARCRV